MNNHIYIRITYINRDGLFYLAIVQITKQNSGILGNENLCLGMVPRKHTDGQNLPLRALSGIISNPWFVYLYLMGEVRDGKMR